MAAPKVLRLSSLAPLIAVVLKLYTLSLHTKCVTFGLSLPRYDVANAIEVPPPEIMRFMRRFGYLEPNTNDSEALYHESAIIEAIKNVQKYGALPQTGKLDNATLHLFSKPRCGVPDIEGTPYYLVTSGTNRSATTTASAMKRNFKNDIDGRQKRFIVGAPTWKKRQIGYFIANWSLKMSQEQIERDIRRALDLWSQFSGLRFIRMNDTSADIIIGFGSKYHGDNYPFDGPNNILAHAYYPYELGSWGGDVHFDEDENWQENSTDLSEGVDFYSVAAHELGHSLGLAHSPVQSSIMFPYYKGPQYATLDADDKMAMSEMYLFKKLEGDDDESFETTTTSTEKSTFGEIDQAIQGNRTYIVTSPNRTTNTATTQPYGNGEQEEMANTTQTFEGDYETITDYRQRYDSTTVQTSITSIINITQHQVTTPPPSTLIPNICRGKFDAVTVFNGSVHIFKRDFVWRISAQYSIENGYPRRIHEVLPFLPTTIKQVDAAYTRHDDTVVIFTGQSFWLFDGNNASIANGPIALQNLLGSDVEVTKIDAAMVWPKNNLTYIFAGDHFWRYNDRSNTLDVGNPRSMKRWPGIPNNIDAATSLKNGKTYFFKDNIYWLYNNYDVRPERGYPRRASTIWLGCKSPTRPALRNFNTTVSFISVSVSASVSSSTLPET